MDNLRKVLAESIKKNPAGLAESIGEELRKRVFEALENVKLYESSSSDSFDKKVSAMYNKSKNISNGVSSAMSKYVAPTIGIIGAYDNDDLTEGMRLAKGQDINHEPDAEAFAKEYVKGKKADYIEGAFTDKQAQVAEKFSEKYKHKVIRSGFGGSGTHHYTNKETGETHQVKIYSNGKGFHGAFHSITKVSS